MGGAYLMTSEVLLQQLSPQLVDVWIDIHRGVYGRYPWPRPVAKADVFSLIDQPDTKSFVASYNGKPVAIASLKVTDNPELLSFGNFASKNATPGVIDSVLTQLIAVARDMGVKQITAWMWDSEHMVMDALIKRGFEVTASDSLISKDLSTVNPMTSSNAAEVRSISEGITVSQFVSSNREAFKDDPSRPLEEKELEEWLEGTRGFHPDCQLAAVIRDDVVGTVMSEVFDRQWQGGNKHEAWIYGLGVVESYRRQGIASLLLQNLESRLKKYGVSRIWLFTDTEGGIRDFYNQAGFVQEVNWVDLGLCIST
jgi:GNAT superfamily N-acetyltransferase